MIGDTLLFTCYSLIGNRLGTLIMSCVPVISSLAAFLFLGEKLGLRSIFGIIICLSGIALVVSERRNGNDNGNTHEKRRFWLGVLAGLGGAMGQAGGLVLAKLGLGGDFPAISGTLIRMLAAMLFIWVITIFMRTDPPDPAKSFQQLQIGAAIFSPAAWSAHSWVSGSHRLPSKRPMLASPPP